jgi:hypothetical protein
MIEIASNSRRCRCRGICSTEQGQHSRKEYYASSAATTFRDSYQDAHFPRFSSVETIIFYNPFGPRKFGASADSIGIDAQHGNIGSEDE